MAAYLRLIREDAAYILIGAVAATTLFCWGYTASHLATHLATRQRHLVVDACDVARDQQ